MSAPSSQPLPDNAALFHWQIPLDVPEAAWLVEQLQRHLPTGYILHQQERKTPQDGAKTYEFFLPGDLATLAQLQMNGWVGTAQAAHLCKALAGLSQSHTERA